MSARNQNTRHSDKSRRRERALERLPALLDMPAPPAEPKKAKPAKRGGRPRIAEDGAVTEAPITPHERDLLAMEKGNYEYHSARIQKHNARVVAERAALESRIGKPPRQWPKRTPVVVHEEVRDVYEYVGPSWGEFMGEVA